MKMIIALLVLISQMNLVFAAPTYLYPDLITSAAHLYDQKIDTTTIPGRKLLRFANATPNWGQGRLEIRGGEINPDGSQQVLQIIYATDGSYMTRLAGSFDYHPDHNHTHFNDFAAYRLRKVNLVRGVGRVIRRSEKVSYCLMDSSVANPRLPGFNPFARYRSCDNRVQGISVGWMDVYGKNLPGQWIDVTGLPAGRYWLESVVDPRNRLKESNENNNLARVMIYLK
jgi:hypothetical protein